MPAAPRDPRLTTLPLSAIAFALGVCVGRPQRPAQAGRVAALVIELRRRGVYDELLANLDPDLAKSILVLEAVDAGQAWNRQAAT